MSRLFPKHSGGDVSWRDVARTGQQGTSRGGPAGAGGPGCASYPKGPRVGRRSGLRQEKRSARSGPRMEGEHEHESDRIVPTASGEAAHVPDVRATNPAVKYRYSMRGRVSKIHISEGEPEKRPRINKSAQIIAIQHRWVAMGRCRICGRKRKSYKYRCDKHQKIENARFRRKYGSRFHTLKRNKEKERIARFLKKLR